MSSKGRNREKKLLQNFKKFTKKAEEADTAERTEDWLSKAAVWAEKLADKKEGEEAEKWQQLAEKSQEKIEKQRSKAQDKSRNNRRWKKTQSRENNSKRDGGPVAFDDPPKLSFEDVGGMHSLISELKERVIFQMEDSPYREALGVSPTNGVLLQGPPGTGKTYISKALAGELGYRYAEVKSSDLLNRYVGETGKAVDALFDQIRNNEPCIVFIDEIEAIASNRQDLGGEGGDKAYEQAISEILQGLDSLQDSDAVVVAATNLMDEIDGAILRSGRFDEKIEVPPPDGQARREILQIHLRDRETEGSFNWEMLAEETEGFSAADLAKTVKAAAQKAHIHSVKSDSLQPINEQLLINSIRDTDPSLKHWNDDD